MAPATKTFRKDNRWVEKKRPANVLVCPSCKTKYIKTRPRQAMCLHCIFHGVVSPKRRA